MCTIFTPDRVVSRCEFGLGPRLPDPSVCDYILRGTLKSKVYYNNPNSLNKLQQKISGELEIVPALQLRSTICNLKTDKGAKK
ncbi:hypothetical protein TNCV_2386141 [Trichonephila clavipes]|nr:hypothetical protein TNCV_2386141 [Trichonephila clavipes]